jgi:transcriptional regulator with XRE-family HTH domain
MERGISQERLAGDADVDRAYVSLLENEESSPTVDLLDKLGTSLKVPLAEFFRIPEPGAKKPKAMVGGRPPSKKSRR